jgi:hypothetical protein
MDQPPRVHGLLAGVGGVNVLPGKIVECVRDTAHRESSADPVWVR